jgi:CYTH domain-containing protein
LSRYQKIESEIVLVITDKVEETSRDIAGLRSLLDYELRGRRSLTIRDTYYDTLDQFLGRNKISFRTRRSGNNLLLSVKSKPTRTAGAGTRRLEIERPLTHTSIRAIARQLGLKGTRSASALSLSREPSGLLAGIGLEVVQERTTRRRSRDIAEHVRGRLHVFAELDIDEVTYKLDSRRVRIFEVEIEAKTAKAMPKMRRVAEALLSNYPSSLRSWAHGKFVTGATIKRLVDSGRLENLTSDGMLGPEAFDRIDMLARTSTLDERSLQQSLGSR